MIKHIFTDMDGTLLNDAGRISAENCRKIAVANIPLTLVSARAPMEMFFAMEALGLDDWQVAFNGGLIFKRPSATAQLEIKQACPLPTTRAQSILWMLTFYFPEVSCSFYSADTWHAEKIDDGILYEASLTHLLPEVVELGALFNRAVVPELFKIMLITFDEKVMADLKKFLVALEISGITIQQSGAPYLELTSAQAKKSHGIAWVMAKEQLDVADTAAFGDGHNDLPMLHLVGTSIAMANATGEVKAVAKFVTKSNNEDGVGCGIENFLRPQ